jgi:hypothetical protein
MIFARCVDDDENSDDVREILDNVVWSSRDVRWYSMKRAGYVDDVDKVRKIFANHCATFARYIDNTKTTMKFSRVANDVC